MPCIFAELQGVERRLLQPIAACHQGYAHRTALLDALNYVTAYSRCFPIMILPCRKLETLYAMKWLLCKMDSFDDEARLLATSTPRESSMY